MSVKTTVTYFDSEEEIARLNIDGPAEFYAEDDFVEIAWGDEEERFIVPADSFVQLHTRKTDA